LGDCEGYYASNLTEDSKYKSRINVIFRVQGGNAEIEDKFIAEAKKVGII